MNGNDSTGLLEKPSGFSLIMNVVPMVHLGTGAALASTVAAGLAGSIAVMVAWVYLVPPLVARILVAAFGEPRGELRQDMASYRVWWALTQLQMPFNRLPVLEETLRLVPGLYAAWIGLWGGRVSARAFIGPGVVITDRYAVDVGRGAVLGYKAALAGHMVVRDEAGRFMVIVAAPRVEADAMVGGGAGLGPGATLRAGHVLPTGRRVGPYGAWPRTGTNAGGA
ncbi:MAG: hypothetical protein AB7U75_20545 [Hyphomicrobiaceae bacterium]